MLRALLTASCLLLSASVPVFGQTSQPSVFDKLMSNVDAQPDFLVTWNLQGDVDFLSGKASEYVKDYIDANPASGIPPVDFKAVMTALGINSIDGIALSSKDLGGQHRTVSFFYMPNGPQGAMKVTGTGNVPLTLGDFAPADSVIALEILMDAPALRGAVIDTAVAIIGEQGRAAAEQKLALPLEPTQVTVDQIISSLDGKVYIFGGMKRGEDGVAVIQFVLKLPKGGKLLRTLRPTVEQMTGGMTMFVEGNNDELSTIFPAPGIPGAAPMVLAFVAEAGEEGALYIASSSEYLAQVRGGKLPTLSSNPEFAKALATLPKEGNCLTYISPAYYQLSFAPMIQQFEQTPTPASPAILHMLRDYLAKFDQPQTTVTFLTPDGMKSIGYSDQAIEDVLVAFPAGIMAAMAIPAFEKVRATSEEKAVTNNLRMIAAAADQYFLETGETEVHISQLVGPGKYIEQLELVAGESYDDLTIYQGYEVISVTLEDGRTVNYGPAGSWVTPAGSESEDWESEAPSEDWSEEDTEDWNDEEWSEESEDSYEEE